MSPAPMLPRPIWLDRFTQRVGRLAPYSDPGQAWREAEAIFDAAADMAPEEAADIWILVPLPDVFASFG